MRLRDSQRRIPYTRSFRQFDTRAQASFRLHFRQSIISCKQINAILIHADSFRSRMLGQGFVQTLRKTELKLSRVIVQFTGFRYQYAILQGGSQPFTLCIESIRYNTLNAIPDGNTTGQFRIACYISAFIQIRHNLQLIGKIHIVFNALHMIHPPEQHLLPFQHTLS